NTQRHSPPSRRERVYSTALQHQRLISRRSSRRAPLTRLPSQPAATLTSRWRQQPTRARRQPQPPPRPRLPRRLKRRQQLLQQRQPQVPHTPRHPQQRQQPPRTHLPPPPVPLLLRPVILCLPSVPPPRST